MHNIMNWYWLAESVSARMMDCEGGVIDDNCIFNHLFNGP